MGLATQLDAIVAENGAVLAIPAERIVQVQHAGFRALAREALGALERTFHWGQVIGSAPRAHAALVQETLQRAGVPHALEFNADELMLLPPGVSKASGAELCLSRLGLASGDAWAIGDGENDVSMLRWAEVGIAPGNAAPAAKAAADVRLSAAYSDAFLDATAPLVQPTPAP